MLENNLQEQNKNDYVKFLNRDNPEENIYVNFIFNVQINDTLLMYHICHLYHNCLKLIDNDEMTEKDIPQIMKFNFVLKSIQEALDNRIKCLSSSYVDDAYNYCFNNPKIFDICLDYFKIIKQELNEIKKQYENKNILSSKELLTNS